MADQSTNTSAAARSAVLTYIAARLGEKSTYQGLALLLSAVGVVLSPGQIAEISAAGAAVIAVIHIVLPSSAP